MDIEAFFERYREAFERGDIDHMVAQYDIPLAVMRPSATRLVEDRVTLRARTIEIQSSYASQGLERVEANGLRTHSFQPGFVIASLSWALYAGARKLLVQIDGTYVIRPDQWEPRIVGLIAHNEYERRPQAPVSGEGR